jgi:predicted CxxxxCH...CXXCH cytochrome family protein
MRAALLLLVCGCLETSPLDGITYDGGLSYDARWTDDIGGARYHPKDYGAGPVHGPEMKLQKQDCRQCHGPDLLGGSGPSCDTCHTPNDPPAWRSNCTYCHGGSENQTGAPPKNLDDTSQGGHFPHHNAHVTSSMTSTLDCTQCHVKATDVMSAGHAFDDTPGRAENDFGAGKSKKGSWDKNGTCSNLYCHGSGRGDDGVAHVGDGKLSCSSCHPSTGSAPADWAKMSGPHSTHLAVAGIGCADCHSTVTSDGTTIANRDLHIDGLRQVSIPTSGFTFDAVTQQCTGSCHNYVHTTLVWSGALGGKYHPAGYSAAAVHGGEMELQRQDCRGCHGATLTGGQGPSCDSCHQANWRTNCTYCHGGSLNQTGAPPRDLASAPAMVSQSFQAHTAHLTQTISAASDCTTCHIQPTDTMTTNHAFDSTPAKAENVFTAGLGPATVYDGKGTCSNNYCHSNGRTNGTGIYRDGSPTPGCGTCHAGQNSGQTAWGTMSSEHRKHLQMSGVTCATCHSSVTSTGNDVIAPLLHVDGKKQVVMNVAGIGPYNPTTKICAGSCHGEGHNDKRW